MKKLFAVILLSLLLASIISCDGSTYNPAGTSDSDISGAENTNKKLSEIIITENNASEYVIVRPDLSLSSDEDVRAAIT